MEIKKFRNFNESASMEEVLKLINGYLISRNLNGCPSTDRNNPQDDILKNNVDYVTYGPILVNNGSAYISVYLNNTEKNKSIANDLNNKFGGDYSTYSQGKYIGVTNINTNFKNTKF